MIIGHASSSPPHAACNVAQIYQTLHNDTASNYSVKNFVSNLALHNTNALTVPTLYAWLHTNDSFVRFTCGTGVWRFLVGSNLVKDNRDLVLIVQQLHFGTFLENRVSHTDTSDVSMRLLRLHSRVTPNTSVLLLDPNISGCCDMRTFFAEMPKSIRFHCVGAGVAAHICAALCRQLLSIQARSCDRIVGLEPKELTFQPHCELKATDAHYVVLVSVMDRPRGQIGIHAHELIVTHNMLDVVTKCSHLNNWHRRICVSSHFGERFCEDVRFDKFQGNIDSARSVCYGDVGYVVFMKSLDVTSTFLLFRVNVTALKFSSWNAYSDSKDYSRMLDFNSQSISSYRVRLSSEDFRSAAGVLIVTVLGKGFLENSDPFFQYRVGNLHFRWYISYFETGWDSIDVFTETGASLWLVKIVVATAVFRPNHKPMTGLVSLETTCTEVYTDRVSGNKKFVCGIKDKAGVPTYRYRHQLNVTGTFAAQVPPTNGCLTFEGWHLKRPIEFWNHTALIVKKNRYVDYTGFIASKHSDLLAVRLISMKTGAKLLVSSFWDSCDGLGVWGIKLKINKNKQRFMLKSMFQDRFIVEMYFEDVVYKLKLIFTSHRNEMFKRRSRRGVVRPEMSSKSGGVNYDHHEASSNPTLMTYYDINAQKFVDFVGNDDVYERMFKAGVFSNGRDSDVVLLVHGWHALQSSVYLFQQLLRFHQKMTPNTTVLFVNWESQGANFIELGNAAFASLRVNLEAFFKGLPRHYNIHCIGHSLGAHACGALCRQYRHIHPESKLCTRIVGLDPASVHFKHDSPYSHIVNRRLSREDAHYVAVFTTNRNFMGLADVIGDEYITPNIQGHVHESCPQIGKWHGEVCGTNFYGQEYCEYMDVRTMFNSGIIPHTIDSCSHLMAPIQFMKLLDIYSTAIVVKLQPSPIVRNDVLPSAWNAYVTSKDYRYSSYYNTATQWYSTRVADASLQMADLFLVLTFPGVSVRCLGGITYNRQRLTSTTLHMCFYGSTYERMPSFNVVTHGGQILLAHFQMGRAAMSNRNVMPKVPMSGVAVRRYICNGTSDRYGEFRYLCQPSFQAYWMPSYRSQLNVTGTVISVPPVNGTCLPYEGEFSDLISVFWGYRTVSLNETLSLNFTGRGNIEELAKVVLQNTCSGMNFTLVTFWEVCSGFNKSLYNITLDRLGKVLNITFYRHGIYELRLYFPFDMVRLNIRAMPKRLTTIISRYTGKQSGEGEQDQVPVVSGSSEHLSPEEEQEDIKGLVNRVHRHLVAGILVGLAIICFAVAGVAFFCHYNRDRFAHFYSAISGTSESSV
ncbi:ORF19 [Aviadenovirus phalacrocoracidae]|uniref:ORF19 n=1 Tax=Aviadenovirus sp. TaxID=2217649 RepID=A0ABZ0T4G9_9ADEN|nr:ORF19 [Aviadenovirus sp.]